MTKTEMQHLEKITNLCIERGTIIEEQAARIAELEAANILLNNTFNVQLKVIREHQAADVIAVEAIRAQAKEIKQLKKEVKGWEVSFDAMITQYINNKHVVLKGDGQPNNNR